MTRKAPVKVFIEGTSFQIKYPKIIAKTKAKYLRGVTNETSENLYDWVSHKFAKPPKIPTIDNKNKSFKLGKTHPSVKILKRLKIKIEIEKNNPISQTGSVNESCLIAIAT